jgi:hypothetical protein
MKRAARRRNSRAFTASALLALAMVACAGDDQPTAAGAGAARPTGASGSSASSGGSTGAVDASGREAGASTALRLTFSPEAITPEADPGLDEMGYLQIQVFDTPNPPAGDAASTIALHEEVTPSDFQTGGLISLAELPTPTVAIPGSLSVVYVRALFVDNALTAARRVGVLPVTWGTWFGGVDVSKGFTQTATLTPVPITPGQTTVHDVPLVAMRRVAVTVTASARPAGDGEGSLSVAATRVEMLPPRVQVYGYGIEPCVDLKSGPRTIDVDVVGSGTFFVAGFFDDLGIQTPGKMPPGTMLSVRDVHLSAGTGTFDRLVLAPGQYSSALSIDLGFVVPLPRDAGAPGPNSCRDLGYGRDGGP